MNHKYTAKSYCRKVESEFILTKEYQNLIKLYLNYDETMIESLLNRYFFILIEIYCSNIKYSRSFVKNFDCNILFENEYSC